MEARNAHQKPPDNVRSLFRAIQKDSSECPIEVFDFESMTPEQLSDVQRQPFHDLSGLRLTFEGFLDQLGKDQAANLCAPSFSNPVLFEFKKIPGRQFKLDSDRSLILGRSSYCAIPVEP